MKKFVTIMAMVLVVVMSLSLFAACGYPNDPDKAVEQLEKKGYDAHVTKSPSDESDVIAVVTATKTNFKLEDLFEMDVEDLVLERVIITYFRTADLAKENLDSAKKDLPSYIQEVAKISRQGSKIVVTYKLTGEDAVAKRDSSF